MRALSCYPPLFFFFFSLLQALCRAFLLIYLRTEGGTLTHASAPPQCNRQLRAKEWNVCVGCKLRCGSALRDGGMSIGGAAIFTNTSFIVLRGELQGAVSLYLHAPLRTWVYLFVSVGERVICRSPGGKHWLRTKWEHGFSNNSEPLSRATQRCVWNACRHLS